MAPSVPLQRVVRVKGCLAFSAILPNNLNRSWYSAGKWLTDFLMTSCMVLQTLPLGSELTESNFSDLTGDGVRVSQHRRRALSSNIDPSASIASRFSWLLHRKSPCKAKGGIRLGWERWLIARDKTGTKTGHHGTGDKTIWNIIQLKSYHEDDGIWGGTNTSPYMSLPNLCNIAQGLGFLDGKEPCTTFSMTFIDQWSHNYNHCCLGLLIIILSPLSFCISYFFLGLEIWKAKKNGSKWWTCSQRKSQITSNHIRLFKSNCIIVIVSQYHLTLILLLNEIWKWYDSDGY